MVQLVLQYRDYQRATQRLAGIPELLNKLRQVQRGAEGCGCRGVGPSGHLLSLYHMLSQHCRRHPSLWTAVGGCVGKRGAQACMRVTLGPVGGKPGPPPQVPQTRILSSALDLGLLVNSMFPGERVACDPAGVGGYPGSSCPAPSSMKKPGREGTLARGPHPRGSPRSVMKTLGPRGSRSSPRAPQQASGQVGTDRQAPDTYRLIIPRPF